MQLIELRSELNTPHGYVLGGNAYLGKKEIRNKETLLGNQVVINLLGGYLGLHHHVYFDSFFSSVNLKGRPEILVRGEFKYFQSSGVTATVWYDNRYICVLSTNSDPKESVSVIRKTGNDNERLAISCPNSIVNYTKFMGGVDRADQKQSYYSLGRKTKKNGGSICLVKPKHGETQKEYRKALYRQMIGNFTSRKRACRKRNTITNVHSFQKPHKIMKIEGRKKVCGKCSLNKKRTASGKSIQTMWKCKNCDLPLCKTMFSRLPPREGN
ncbi:hypothetical protein J437_LFUL016504 [Ladona fulva]|uniref:PiggyBac transposable element-derived protein domain-containing protein n=1 Tax=Ladona fulva TaxID=123851 RepID=A0A8K0KLZ3_LADFU|nr:hypothetical protein J437_LFUL016504 [Ladona fulva]